MNIEENSLVQMDKETRKNYLVNKKFELKIKLDKALRYHLEDVKSSKEEIDLIIQLMDKFGHDHYFQLLVQDALESAQQIVSDGHALIKASRLLDNCKI